MDRAVEDLNQHSPDDERFAFGHNWKRFLATIDQQRIDAAQQSLLTLLHTDNLHERRFLDAGSGSGLFSLAATRLGADVISFDMDPECVACNRELQQRFCTGVSQWKILSGSILDEGFLRTLGTFDIVYCWGAVHNTGSMWNAIENLAPLVARGGTLVLAIFNDQLYISRAWRGVKRVYQRLPRMLRPLFVIAVGLSTFVKRLVVTLLAILLRLLTFRNPVTPVGNWIRETHSRGMHGWYDLVNWVGGWPFEVARPEEVFRFLRDRGFTLQELTTSSGHGCNEFVFVRNTNSAD